MQISKEQIDLALKNKEAVKFENVFDNDFTWENFIDFINFAIKQDNPNASSTEVKTTIGYVNFWHRLTMTLDGLLDSYFPNLELRNSFLSSFIDSRPAGKFGVVSFTDSEPTTGKHSDPVNVMYWGCLGNVEWSVYPESGTQTFIISPGDVIFVPAELMHEVKSLEPRAAISFMFEK